MKRLIIIIAITLAMCMPVLGVTYSAFDNTTFNNGYQWAGGSKDRASVWAQEVQSSTELSGGLGTGDIRYVDSGRGASGDGKAWSRAVITLDEAVALCTANNGDVILIAQGHAETLTGADGFDLDVAGITVIGLGNGDDRPTFTYTATAAEGVFGAASVVLYNVILLPASSTVTMGLSIEAAADNCAVIKVEFAEPTVATYDFVDGIDVAALSDGLEVINCVYRHVSTTGPAHFIEAGNGQNNYMKIVGNDIAGEFSVSAIWSDVADEWCLIEGNKISNLTSGQHAIEFTAAAEGMICYNAIHCSATPTSIDPGSMFSIENYVQTTIDRSGNLYPEP